MVCDYKQPFHHIHCIVCCSYWFITVNVKAACIYTSFQQYNCMSMEIRRYKFRPVTRDRPVIFLLQVTELVSIFTINHFMFCTSAAYLRRFGKIQGSTILSILSIWRTTMRVWIEKYSFIYADWMVSFTFIGYNFIFYFTNFFPNRH